MANVEINDLTLKATPVINDEIEIQDPNDGLSYKSTINGLSYVVGSQVHGMYIFTKTSLAHNEVWDVPDFAGVGEPGQAFFFISNNSAIIRYTNFMFASAGNSNVNKIYGVTGGPGFGYALSTSNPDQSGEINVWIDFADDPPSMHVKQRSGETIDDFRVFIFSISENGA